MKTQSSRAPIGLLIATLLASAGVGAVSCSSTETGNGGSGGTSANGGGGGGGGGGLAEDCTNPKPYPDGTSPTGYVICDGGLAHRPEIVTCTSDIPTHVSGCSAGSGGGAPTGCVADSDCTDKPNGFCDYQDDGVDDPSCNCRYGCLQDADCGSDEICVCGHPAGTCIKATCKSDADCGGHLCATYDSAPGCGFWRFACDTDDDECHVDSDCPDNFDCGLENGHRKCLSADCQIGRPFLVEDAPRVAPAERRADWACAEAMPDLTGLDLATRRELAEHWTRSGQMEHASIAAFARFTLDLLSLGAPAELVARSNAAMADETRHAELAFAFASAYAGVDVGPGQLEMSGALDRRDRSTIVTTAILEGCIGETLAAIEAAKSAELAVDPVVRAALAGIAVDEARHADLAWDFVAWALARSPELVAAARAAFAIPLASTGPALVDLTDRGVLAGPHRDAIRASAMREAVAPLEKNLLRAA